MSDIFLKISALPRTGSNRLFWQALLLTLLVMTAQYNYLLFHSLAELYSIVIAFGIFLIAWNARYHYNNDYLLFIGIAYLFVASFDTLHMLGYHGMSIFKDLPGYNLGPQLWLIARTLEACTLLIAPAFIHRPLRQGPVFAIYLILSLIALWSIFMAQNFPACFSPESGLSAFKIGAEYVIIALLLAALGRLVRHRHGLDRNVYRLLIASILLTVASELCFTLYISHYGLANLAGHLFKIVSFTQIYVAIIETTLRRPFALLFRDLKEREDGMLAAQNAAQLGSWSWRLDRNAMIWTEGMYRQLGLLPGKEPPTLASLLGVLRKEDRKPLQTAIDQLQQEGKPFQLVVTRYDAKQMLRYLHIEGARALNGCDESLLAGVVQDVTDRIATERLREDMDLITRHDLRSPLTPIIGIPEFLLSSGNNLTREQREMLDSIKQSGLKMLAMLNNSLTLFKIEKGTYQLQPDIFDLLEALREVLCEIATRSGIQSQLSLRVDNDREPNEGEQLFCYGEKLLCQSLFSNLIRNAVEASPPEEQVIITVKDSSSAWRVIIHNAGEVPEPMRAHFFDKYATYGKQGGTGLGTYSALLAVRAHGGTIHLDTGKDGTTLTVVLPKPEEFNTADTHPLNERPIISMP